ncbi:hypothetical protein A2972_01075 [Candidatus Amesbacteria bacterium RIFCSPLOWO2_01_FULL_47_33]|uniref:HIT domain-containing protein n=2 Tax=Candidatus Amesiibacteriota TaxID=1752730 RepID=A0A1F4ZU53_9BACT|nr:MAG: hypothetical protein A2972_01075 [Candidatus Amesbacteria bacterium RIFCSPLOWO2_01_FULL_47_33]OGD08997.1 MAG: hypothetical protein A2395_01700 [Candidatus Amesbacteria bacterium RIFOXYB1_FULL_47_9]
MNEKDDFSTDNQLNLRLRGGYEKLAEKILKNSCPFCNLKEKYILAEKDGLVLTVNIFPYIDGQLMVIPRRHIKSFEEVTVEETVTNYFLSQLAITLLREELGVKGVWMLLRDGGLGSESGKTVEHLHWNILPYTDSLNTWHHQELSVTPAEMAVRLRSKIDK